MTAVFCHNAADRKAETWKSGIGAVLPPGVRHLRRGQGDRGGRRAGGGAARRRRRCRRRRWSTAWTSSTPRWKPTGSWPGTGVTPRPPGTGGGRRGQGRPSQPAGVDARGPAGRSPRRLATGDRGLGAGRAHGSGLAAGPCRAGVVPTRRPTQRPRPAEAEIAAALPGPRPAPTGQGPQLPHAIAAAWPSWTGCTAGWSRPSRGGVARGDGLALVAAAPPVRRQSDPLMALVRAVGRERPLTERGAVRRYDARVGGAGGHGPGQQRGGVHEQRAADAAVAAPPDDAADARPEAALLELPSVPLRPEEGRLPYRALGLDLPTFDFWELLQTDSGPVDATTVNSRKYRMRQSRGFSPSGRLLVAPRDLLFERRTVAWPSVQTSPTRQRREPPESLAGASGWYKTAVREANNRSTLTRRRLRAVSDPRTGPIRMAGDPDRRGRLGTVAGRPRLTPTGVVPVRVRPSRWVTRERVRIASIADHPGSNPGRDRTRLVVAHPIRRPTASTGPPAISRVERGQVQGEAFDPPRNPSRATFPQRKPRRLAFLKWRAIVYSGGV